MLRTNTCGELRRKDINKTITLCGWVQSRRDHGGVIFIDLRDRYGLTQVVFDPSHLAKLHKEAEHLGREFVIKVKGKLRERKKGMINPNMDTGEVEMFADELEILNKSDVPPFEIDDRKLANEFLRLKYRYLDLRRPEMQRNLLVRHKVALAAREYLSSKGFLEIETPLLIRSTPEGARDFVVPSRVSPGKFYSLPQSPQLYKQILMVSGCDRYFQIARCLRDEDNRGDRQPEFTQIDIEMSFAEQEDIFQVVEGLMKECFKKGINAEIKTPFKRMTYDEAMNKYGVDKPDLRFGLELCDVSEIVKHSNFGVFKQALDNKGVVKCLNVKKCAEFSRKDIDELEEVAKVYRAKGLAWMKMANGKLESSVTKYFSEELLIKLIKHTNAKNGDLLLFVADEFRIACSALGQIRNHLGKKLNLINKDAFEICWVTDFPLFEWDNDTERWLAMHHIFTAPRDEDLELLETDPGKVKGKLYDMVINGYEICSGSIRINRRDVQQRVMDVIGLTMEDAEQQFGFLMEAFRYGAPPHGGIAPGFDRLLMVMLGYDDIREVYAFPKNKKMECPMDGCPSDPDKQMLKDLHIKLDIAKK
ncbi:aspartate--tRNA ligase [Candidatus Woesearchaeota archaeon]|nr:aspartate--tRNA ligase [Candidatus Woesearchaeota archaeon]